LIQLYDTDVFLIEFLRSLLRFNEKPEVP